MISLAEMESSEIRRLPNETPTHLRSLELVQLDELNVTTGTQSSLTDSSPESPTTLRVHCQGPLLFDFVGGSVTLQDQVAIQRQSTKQQAPNQQHGSSSALQLQPKSDWLTCDTLAMQFQRSVKESTAEAVADGTQRQGNSDRETSDLDGNCLDFELAQISAFGSPSVVDAPTYQVRAQAEKIELHLSHNRLLLQDTNEAILQFDTHTFRAPQMQYFVDPQGGPGRAEVVGGGQYVGTLQDDVVQLLWKDSLNFGPRDGKYLLDVSGQAHIQWGKRELGKDGKSDARSKTLR